MKQELRPDFLNLHELLPQNALTGLRGLPHLLKDTFGNVLSSHAAEQAGNDALDIMLKEKVVVRLYASTSQHPLLKSFLETILESEFRAAEAASTLEASQLLAHDLDALLELSEAEAMPLEEILQHFLRLLRAHVWVERCSLFGIQDGFTLEGLASIGWEGRDDWKTLYSTVAGVAASTRKPYVVENPAKDKLLQGRVGLESFKNLICFPLLHGSTLVGVLNLSNCVGGPFTESNSDTVRRFANVASHLLQKHFFKTRMESLARTSDHLGKYLSSKVVKSVKTKDQVELGGTEKKVVCLFSDIRGYTSITEGIPPSTLVKLLNFHFDKMHAIIEKHEGTLDKIVGDLIMAVWNIPNDQPEPELLAMKAAIEMQKEMIRVVVPEWQRHGVDQVGMGVGVNAGPAIVGNLGSSRFMNYTVVGDTINTAQRLESKAKSGEVWMAEPLFPFVNGKLEKPVRRELEIRLKGKDKAINALVYRPLGY